jgi:hypothetical protein
MNMFAKFTLVFCLSTVSMARASVSGDVPAPDSKMGTLIVSGKPDKSQPSEFNYISCSPDSAGNPMRGGCGERILAPLNKPIKVQEGLYWVSYDHTSGKDLISVQRGKVTELKLVQLKIDALPSGVSFNMFIDLTSQIEQTKLFLYSWGYGLNPRHWQEGSANPEQGCSVNPDVTDPLFIQYCAFWHARNWDTPEFRGFASFSEKAELSSIRLYLDSDGSGRFMYGQWTDPARSYLLEGPTKAKALAVFPGIYGIQYYKSGRPYSDFYGIEAK